MTMRLLAKLMLRRFFLLPSFCKRCGRRVRDFEADDATWARVRPFIRHGGTLCYDCFCDLTGEVYRVEVLR